MPARCPVRSQYTSVVSVVLLFLLPILCPMWLRMWTWMWTWSGHCRAFPSMTRFPVSSVQMSYSHKANTGYAQLETMGKGPCKLTSLSSHVSSRKRGLILLLLYLTRAPLGGAISSPPSRFLAISSKPLQVSPPNLQSLSPNIFTHCVKILKSRVS